MRTNEGDSVVTTASRTGTLASAEMRVAQDELDTVERRRFCANMLPRVSRTFALSISFLPERLKHPVSVSYLLCRIADTLEDSPNELLRVEEKVQLLGIFRDSLDSPDIPNLNRLQCAFDENATADQELVRRCDIVLNEFHSFPESKKSCIRPWVQEMCDGMAEYVSKSSHPADQISGGVETTDDLEQYCYFVAGTVGNLLTDLFYDERDIANEKHKALARRFGLGLQLTNIIKDLCVDTEGGRYFIPRDACQSVGITQEDFFEPDHAAAAQKIILSLVARAKEHLKFALEYCLGLPRTEYGIRMFCLVSMFLALKTLALVKRRSHALGRGEGIKISRPQVYRTALMSSLIARSNLLCQLYFGVLARAV